MWSTVGVVVWCGLSVAGYTACPDDPEHLGCYSTSGMEGYKIPHSLSWVQSVAFCDHRAVRYMGLQANESVPSTNTVYCLSDVTGLHRTDNSSWCSKCVDPPEQLCGGQQSMSLYKIRDTSPLTILMSTSTGAQFVRGGEVSTVYEEQRNTQEDNRYSVDYLYSKDELIFHSGRNIHSSLYNPEKMKYGPLFNHSNFKTKQNDIFADWVDGRVWGWFLSEHVAKDPYERINFKVSNNTLRKANMEDSNYECDNENLHIEVKAISLDTPSQTVYMVSTDTDDRTVRLASVDYDCSQYRVLYSGPQLQGVYRLDVVQDQAVWLVNNSDEYVIYRCTLSPTCQENNVSEVYRSPQAVYDFKIYSAEKQKPKDNKRLCKKLYCSHNCTILPNGKPQCTCPPDLTMTADNRTCLDVQTLGTTTNAQNRPTIETSMDVNDHQSTEEVQSSESSTVAVDVRVEPATSTSQTSQTPKDLGDNSNHNYVQWLRIWADAALISVLAGVIYIMMKRRQKNNRFSSGNCPTMATVTVQLSNYQVLK